MGRRHTLFCRALPPADGLARIAGDALTLVIQNAKVELGAGVTLLGEGLPLRERSGKVRSLIRKPPRIEICTRRPAVPNQPIQAYQSA